MENLNELTKKSNNTFVFVETSNKTIGPHYFPSLNLCIMLDHTKAHINPPSKSGMGYTRPLNPHYNYKPDYKARMSVFNI